MRNLKVIFLHVVVLLQVAATNSYAEARRPAQKTIKFELANLLQSNMVIQQDKPLKLWGTAPEGSTVTITPDWSSKAVAVRADKQGKWIANVPVPAAIPGDFKPHTLLLTHEKESIRLDNLLIGEVWLCSGQSNMDMEMKAAPPWLEGVIDYEKEIAAANQPSIRFINIENKFTKQPQTKAKGEWKVCTPETAGELSGVAYYFGRELVNKLHVPVGLVVSSMGATAAQAWTSREVLEADPVLKDKYLEPYDNSPQAAESLDSIKTMEKLFEVLSRPTLLYNAMIFPIKDLSIRGFLWYQGESNKKEADTYARLATAMLQGWRNDFNQGDLPFYYVQLTPYNWEENDPNATYYARLREAQEAMLQVKNTGMAVTMDIGEVNNIHPRNKKDVGLRLSRIALNKTYGLKDVAHLGPKYKEFIVEKDGTVKVSFTPESIGSGLATSDKQAPKHFYLAGADKVFYEAEARIVNDQVWLHSDKVKKPVAVRYAFTNYPITNLQNKEGLPAMPFRTDNWEEQTDAKSSLNK